MSKKGYSVFDWEEEGLTPRKSKFSSWYSYYQNIWKGFDWSHIAVNASNKEDIINFKDKVKKAADKFFLPVKINVSGIYTKLDTFFLWKYVINVPTSEMDSININKLIKAIQMLPERSHEIHSFWVRAYVTNKLSWYDTYCTEDLPWFLENNDNYFSWKLSFDEYSKHFVARESLPSGKYGNGWWSAWLFFGGDEVWHLRILDDLTNYTTALKKIGKKLIKQTARYYEESLRKGNRINPKFITGQSVAPLLKRTTLGNGWIPRVMVIVDCSGSMGWGTSLTDRSNMSASFAAALNNSGIANVSHIVYHSDSGWVDVKKKADKGEIAVMTGGGDGFQYMDDNLPSEWVKDVEYVLVLTDLEYDETNQWGLLEYVKRAPAHLILTFSGKPSVSGIKAEKVSSIEDMAKATVKLNTKLTRQ